MTLVSSKGVACIQSEYLENTVADLRDDAIFENYFEDLFNVCCVKTLDSSKQEISCPKAMTCSGVQKSQ